MYIGLGIFLLVVGAILSFAVRDSVSGVDLTTIGYILMGGGALAVILSLVMRGGSGYRTKSVSQVDPATGTRVDETRVDRDGL
jgi:predicted anti-sigma-YlaC factor YlaD